MAEGAFPSRFATILTLAAALCPLMIRPLIGADVLTQHYNNARTGAMLDETMLNTTNVSSGSFGKLWTLYADGQVVAQPLYVSALPIDTTGNPNTPLVQGTFNAVIVATMHNTVYVYDADKENRGARRPHGSAVGDVARSAAPRRQGHRHVEHQRSGVGHPQHAGRQSATSARCSWSAWHDDGAAGPALQAARARPAEGHAPPAAGRDRRGVERSVAIRAGRRARSIRACTSSAPALLLAGGVLYVGVRRRRQSRRAVRLRRADARAARVLELRRRPATTAASGSPARGPRPTREGNVYLMTGNGTFDAQQRAVRTSATASSS